MEIFTLLWCFFIASMLRSPILGKLALSTGTNCASVFSSLFLRPWSKQTTSFTWLMLALMVPGKMPVSTICQNWRKALKVWKTYWGIQSSWKEVTIPGDDVPVPYYIYTKGDSSNSFGIKNDRWTRFLAEKKWTPWENIFKLQTLKGQVCSGETLWFSGTQVLSVAVDHEPETYRKIITTCVIFHNLIRLSYSAINKNLMDLEDQNQNVIPVAWRNDKVLLGEQNNINTREL